MVISLLAMDTNISRADSDIDQLIVRIKNRHIFISEKNCVYNMRYYKNEYTYIEDFFLRKIFHSFKEFSFILFMHVLMFYMLTVHNKILYFVINNL